MSEIIAFCGLRCDECPAYLARRSDDAELRKKTAAEWSQQYGASIEPGQIDCDGCLPGAEVQFAHCRECGIRACATERGRKSCALCSDYPCGRLQSFFEWVPEARETLDALAEKTDG